MRFGLAALGMRLGTSHCPRIAVGAILTWEPRGCPMMPPGLPVSVPLPAGSHIIHTNPLRMCWLHRVVHGPHKAGTAYRFARLKSPLFFNKRSELRFALQTLCSTISPA